MQVGDLVEFNIIEEEDDGHEVEKTLRAKILRFEESKYGNGRYAIIKTEDGRQWRTWESCLAASSYSI